MSQIKIEFPMYAITGSLYNNIEINAADIVKEAADYVTETNEEGGVAKAIYRFVLTR